MHDTTAQAALHCVTTIFTHCTHFQRPADVSAASAGTPAPASGASGVNASPCVSPPQVSYAGMKPRVPIQAPHLALRARVLRW